MNALTSDPFAIPTLLYGDRRTVRRAWRRICREVAQARDWEKVVTDLEFASLREVAGEIMLKCGRNPRRPHEVCWRVHWIHQTGAFMLNDAEPMLSAEDALLIASGMKYLWFTLGMACVEDADEPIVPGSPDEERAAIYRPMLRWYVHWLPEMMTIQHRFSDDFFESHGLYRRRHRFDWLLHVIALGFRIGLIQEAKFPTSWEVLLAEKYRGNVPRALEAWGLISRRNGKYVLFGE
jgi:hypothetical protein